MDWEKLRSSLIACAQRVIKKRHENMQISDAFMVDCHARSTTAKRFFKQNQYPFADERWWAIEKLFSYSILHFVFSNHFRQAIYTSYYVFATRVVAM